MINISTAIFPCNITYNLPNFTGVSPHVTILIMLEVIRTFEDGLVDELSVYIISELRKRGTFVGFSEEIIQSLLEVMWNKVEYALKDS